MKEWQLVSGKLSDGMEVLVLKHPSGRTWREYAPGEQPNGDVWHAYEHQFPCKRLSSRAACIRDAEKLSGQILKVVSFPEVAK